MRADIDTGVAIAAVHAQGSDVKLVAVGDGLLGGVTDIGIARVEIIADKPDEEQRGGATHEGTNQRNSIEPLWKKR